MALIKGSNFNDDVRVGGGGVPTKARGLALASTDDDDTINVGNGNDVVLAGGGNDIVSGGNGKDWLEGGLGDDTVRGNNGVDSLFGQDGNDALYGDNGNDLLDGGLNDDSLFGGNGKDTLIGGGGIDTMSGGLGPDTFVFNAVTDSALATPDTITDFKSHNDKLNFSAIDTDAVTDGDQAFTWGGTTAGGAFSIWYVAAGGNSTVYTDSTGDGVADMAIILTGVTNLNASDIIL